MASFKNLTFLKVLASLAWADGELTHAELNQLKALYRKFNLRQSEIDQIKPYLRAPIPKKEEEALSRKLIAELNSAKERAEIRSALVSLVDADKKMHPAEKAFLKEFDQILENDNFTKRSFGKVRNIFSQVLFKPARERNPEMVQYFKARIQKQFELKSIDPDVEWSDNQYEACLLGALMNCVAFADEDFSEKETDVLADFFHNRFGFDLKTAYWICEISKKEQLEDFDFYEVVNEVNRVCSHNERLEFMQCLFKMGAADGLIGYEEVEEIRRVTKALKISHNDFINCKKKFREKKDGF